jgi:hypothetical protein
MLAVRRLATVAAEPAARWQLVVGLEIHAQIKSHSKLFSGASAEYEVRQRGQLRRALMMPSVLCADVQRRPKHVCQSIRCVVARHAAAAKLGLR